MLAGFRQRTVELDVLDCSAKGQTALLQMTKSIHAMPPSQSLMPVNTATGTEAVLRMRKGSLKAPKPYQGAQFITV